MQQETDCRGLKGKPVAPKATTPETRVMFFDVVETVFSLAPLHEKFVAHHLPVEAALYQPAARKYSCDPSCALLVAAHARDVHGAMRAGFHGIWVRRREASYHSLMGSPDHQVNDLVEAVDLGVHKLRGAISHWGPHRIG